MASKKQTDLVKTREQRYTTRPDKPMYIPWDLPDSLAWRVLKKISMQVYLLFMKKRVMLPCPHKPGKSKKDFFIANNGEIQFTYKEALNKHSITRPRFSSAIDQLVEVGLLDIAYQGSGRYHDKTLYAISERWRNYGTPEFIVKKRVKAKQSYGYRKGHK